MVLVIRPGDGCHTAEGWRRCLGEGGKVTFDVVNTLARSMVERILEELSADPRMDAARIHVSAGYGGTATLDGSVCSYAQKCWAEEIARGVPGVTAVTNELEVRLTIGDYRTDAMLLHVVREVLDALCSMPDVRPAVAVREGWITLTGAVDWPFQKQGAAESIRQIAGIRGITNDIRVEPRSSTYVRSNALARP
jgi:osmotically-inducible protein OsmY